MIPGIPAISTDKYRLSTNTEYLCVFCLHYEKGICDLTKSPVKKFHKCLKFVPLRKGAQNGNKTKKV